MYIFQSYPFLFIKILQSLCHLTTKNYASHFTVHSIHSWYSLNPLIKSTNTLAMDILSPLNSLERRPSLYLLKLPFLPNCWYIWHSQATSHPNPQNNAGKFPVPGVLEVSLLWWKLSDSSFYPSPLPGDVEILSCWYYSLQVSIFWGGLQTLLSHVIQVNHIDQGVN